MIIEFSLLTTNYQENHWKYFYVRFFVKPHMFCILLDYLLWLDNPEIIGNFLFVQILYLLVDHLTSSTPELSSTNAKRIFSGCKLNVWTAGFCLLRTNSVFVWVSHTEDWLTFQQDLSLKNKNFPASCLQPIVKLFTVLQKKYHLSQELSTFHTLNLFQVFRRTQFLSIRSNLCSTSTF